MLSIIAGQYRSRRLLPPPDGVVSRPYAQRVKESLFSRLRGWFDGARVLDLFAGVGTVGLEAASRGAAAVVMVERNRRIFRLLQRNIERLDCGDRVRAVNGDALGAAALGCAPAPVDLVFLDPPYATMQDEASRRRVREQMARCRPIMAGRSFLILRSPLDPADEPLPVAGLEGPEAYRYGAAMWVLLYAPAGGRR